MAAGNEKRARHMEMGQQFQYDIADELDRLAFSVDRLPRPGHMSVAGASTHSSVFLLAVGGGHARSDMSDRDSEKQQEGKGRRLQVKFILLEPASLAAPLAPAGFMLGPEA